jgi:hypothetical protein
MLMEAEGHETRAEADNKTNRTSNKFIKMQSEEKGEFVNQSSISLQSELTRVSAVRSSAVSSNENLKETESEVPRSFRPQADDIAVLHMMELSLQLPGLPKKSYLNVSSLSAAALVAQLGAPTYNLLCIDMRPQSEFLASRIQKSVNVEFPSLVLKRLKKNMFTNFNLANFLVGAESRANYDEWVSAQGLGRGVCVYDADMSGAAVETFVGALAAGLGDELLKGLSDRQSCAAATLDGGWEAFSSYSPARTFIVPAEQTDLPPSPAAQEQAVGKPAKGGLKSKPKLLIGAVQLPSLVGPTSNGSTASNNSNGATLEEDPATPTVLNVAQKSRNMSLALVTDLPRVARGVTAEGGMRRLKVDPDEESPESAYDNAAPPEPYSAISKGILIGSDQVPLAPDAVAQLHAIGVTHILNMAAEVVNAPWVVESGEFGVKWIPVRDNTEQGTIENVAMLTFIDMDEPLQEAVTFMRTQMKLFITVR